MKIVIGIGTVLVKIGGIKELTAVVRDRVRSQVESEVKHDAIRDTMNKLRNRLDRREASRWGVGGRDN